MKIEPGEFGGIDVELTAGDKLDDVPDSHQHLISAELRAAFVDPRGHLQSVAERCPFSSMKEWLTTLCGEGEWSLQMHLWAHDNTGSAGFSWSGAKVSGAVIGPATEGEFPADYPADFRAYYDLVDFVDWMGCGAGGGFYGAGEHRSLYLVNPDLRSDEIEPEESYVWGDSPCGDKLFWTMENQGGWYNTPEHKVHLLGTIADTINWVYEELIADRTPGWQYGDW